MSHESPDCGCGAHHDEHHDGGSGPLDFGSRLLKVSAMSASGFAKEVSALVSSALPGLGTFRLRRMCEIPETHCPPKSLGTICWRGCSGALLTHTIRLTNTSSHQQVYTLSATPFIEPGGGQLHVALDHDELTLAAGESGFVEAAVKIPDAFPAGHYQTRILVTGMYEQYVDVTLCVHSRQECTLEVSQGDIPTHIHAHRWYHHFQCIEPCFPKAEQRSKGEVMYPRAPLAEDVTVKS